MNRLHRETAMNLALRTVTALAATLSLAVFAQQPQAQLAAPADRITDSAIQSDHGVYRAMQQRIEAINARGRPLLDYHLSKSQCWLDVSFHEYTRNDRGAFPQKALDEAGRLVVAMENGTALPDDTPLVNDATRLRPDLWERVGKLRQHAGFRCAQQHTACAEVELVHAGNEYRQQGWRHAAPYVQIAEDRLGRAAEAAEACVVAAAPPAPVTPAPVVVAPQPAVPVTLRARMLFVFDGATQGDILAVSRKELQELVDTVKARGLTVRAISITGHADRLNGTGNAAYNSELSRRRMVVVRDLLASSGLNAATGIKTEFVGDSQPLDDCRGFSSGPALRDCLQSNRRVEVTVEAQTNPRRN
jgi:outer membrane protein OmpA-like peptidoglycan-associated protein